MYQERQRKHQGMTLSLSYTKHAFIIPFLSVVWVLLAPEDYLVVIWSPQAPTKLSLSRQQLQRVEGGKSPGAIPGAIPGWGVHLPNSGRSFTKMGGPYTASHIVYIRLSMYLSLFIFFSWLFDGMLIETCLKNCNCPNVC